jgi:hypothetical protein
MQAVYSSETFLLNYQVTAQCENPEDHNTKLHRRETLNFTDKKFPSMESINKVDPLYEQGYVTPCAGNLTEEKSRVGMVEFPTAV